MATVQNNQNTYFMLIRHADHLFNEQNFKNAALSYTNAFKVTGDKGLVQDRYNAACAWAMCGYTDCAFMQLERIVVKAMYDDYNHVSTDPDLENLHKDERWKPLLESIRQNSINKQEQED